MIRVLIERRIKPDCELEFWEMTAKLRAKAVPRPGYVSGETWVGNYDPSYCMVISTWLSVEAWKAWDRSEERRSIEEEMEPLLFESARTTVLRSPQGVEVHWDAGLPVANP